jgi:hypothetical protein
VFVDDHLTLLNLSFTDSSSDANLSFRRFEVILQGLRIPFGGGATAEMGSVDRNIQRHVREHDLGLVYQVRHPIRLPTRSSVGASLAFDSHWTKTQRPHHSRTNWHFGYPPKSKSELVVAALSPTTPRIPDKILATQRVWDSQYSPLDLAEGKNEF